MRALMVVEAPLTEYPNTDWAHGAAEIKYAFTIELPDRGAYGFLLPARFIKPTGEETVDALVAMLNEIKKEIA